MAEYELRLNDSYAAGLAHIPSDRIISLSYTLVTNDVGTLVLELPADAVPDENWMIDGQIEVRRRSPGGSWNLEGGTRWLIQKITKGISQGSRYRRITALSANTLLTRRYTIYYAGSLQVTASDAADDIMKKVVHTNLTGAANETPLVTPTRIMDQLRHAEDVSAGPVLTKEYAWRNVMSVLQDLAADAAVDGTYLYFGVIWTGLYLTFRTWTGQPGVDRTSSIGRLVISPERGTLGGVVERSEDWMNAATMVVTGGQGAETNRAVGIAYDGDLVDSARYGLRELFVSATGLSVEASLDAEARSILYQRRPRRTLTGDIVSIPRAQYGLDWGWGDRLIAQFEGEEFVALVDTVAVEVSRGVEAIQARITGESVS
jgi:hypothetical protein